jgi:hypothetical protein
MLKTQDYFAPGLSKSAGKTASNHNKLVTPALSIRGPRQISSLTTRIGQCFALPQTSMPKRPEVFLLSLLTFVNGVPIGAAV